MSSPTGSPPSGSTANALLVVSGPSGSGKTTICKELAKDPRIRFSVSATTRAIRKGEVDGRDYWFLSKDEFARRVASGAFLEHVSYNGNRYGTLVSEVEKAAAAGQMLLLEIEVQGTEKLRQRGVPGLYVFVVAEEEALRERLSARGTEDPDEVERRLAIAREEMKKRDLYDHVIVNDDLQRAVVEARALVDRHLGAGSARAGR